MRPAARSAKMVAIAWKNTTFSCHLGRVADRAEVEGIAKMMVSFISKAEVKQLWVNTISRNQRQPFVFQTSLPYLWTHPYSFGLNPIELATPSYKGFKHAFAVEAGNLRLMLLDDQPQTLASSYKLVL
eukprot:TRINITY_DN12281_c1_g6_i5.p2 TRINITY_DN12281_c1_g6~~TRINITY_DN12281_c1_g6_i5.p2  ORF type:complete len:128 (-),score=12.26 TRINITY_DN12281_c1_g6_i5:400-783(-)